MPDVAVQQIVSGEGNYVLGTGDVTVHNRTVVVTEREGDAWRALGQLADRVRVYRLSGPEIELDRLSFHTFPAPDAVDSALAPATPAHDSVTPPASSQTSLVALFDQSGGALLILGREGSGKTTALLQLGRALLDRAADDPARPVPVVVDLASWSQSGADMAAWLARQLQSRYLVPEGQARRWLEEQRLVLLLDGLDEVTPERRGPCVTAINDLLRETGAAGVVVCTRTDDYLAQPERLHLASAVSLAPLSFVRVEAHLRASGARQDALRAAIDRDPALRELATSPLMLGVMTVAYEGAACVGEAPPTPEGARARVFERYVARMFARRRGEGVPFDPARTVVWLRHLARLTLDHAQPDIIVEQMQPSWLPTRVERVVYLVVTRLMCGLVLGAFEGPYDLWCAFSRRKIPVLMGHDGAEIVVNVVNVVHIVLAAVGAGVLFGLGVAAVDGARWWVRARAGKPDRVEVWWRTVAVAAAYWIMFAAILWVVGINPRWRSAFGIVWALLFALRGRAQSASSDVRPVLGLAWTWRGAARGLGLGAAVGAMFDVAAYLTAPACEHGLGTAVWIVAGVYVVGHALVGVAMGGTTRVIGGTSRAPREGQLAFWWALRGGLFMFAMTFSVVLGIFLVVHASGSPVDTCIEAFKGTAQSADGTLWWGQGTFSGVLVGAYAGAIGALWFGGADAIQHLVLRWLLWVRGWIPWRVSRFFAWCTHLVLLKRVGRGVRFVHGSFAEHLAREQP